MRTFSAVALTVLLAACSEAGAPDNAMLAESEAKANIAAADDGRISCALGGATHFDRTCTLDRMSGTEGPILVVGRSDVGFRRFLIANDGRGLVSADGSEAAIVKIISDGLIEVSVANDRYRFPATVKAPAVASAK